jgi:carbonic anhydrase
MPQHRFATCTCCNGVLSHNLDRRNFVRLAGAAGVVAAMPAFLTSPIFAAEGNYEAMVLTCIDPRFPELTLNYLRGQGQAGKCCVVGKYSQFSIAGAAIGVVAPAFQDWHKTFWDNLAASIQLHSIPKVVAINHRDCGAAKIAYGEAAVATPAAETATHRNSLAEFRKQVAQRQPKLTVETGLMALDGKVEMFA